MSVAAAAVVVGRREGGRRCGCEVWGVGEYRGRDKSRVEDTGAWSLSCWGKEVNTHIAGFHLHAATDGRTRLLQKSKSRQKQRVYLPQVELQHGPGGVGE